jgi:hypothetical protein
MLLRDNREFCQSTRCPECDSSEVVRQMSSVQVKTTKKS